MRLRYYLPKIQYGPYDTVLHAGISGLLTIILSYFIAPFSAVCFVLAIGVLKEVIDALRPKDRFDIRDIASNILGSAIGYSLIQLSSR